VAEFFYTVSPDLHRAARLEKGGVVEIDFEMPHKPSSLLGGIFLGRVVEVQQPLAAAFVDIGQIKPGMLPLREGGLGPLKQGDTVLVQVTRDENPIEGKGVRLTRLISLALGPLLYTPFTPGLSLSKKLRERDSFKSLISLEPEEGLIVRHWASPHNQLDTLLSQLRAEWQRIQDQLPTQPPPCLSPAPTLFERIVRSLSPSDTLTVDDMQLGRRGGTYSREHVFDDRCEDAWESLLSPEVPLPQGGNLYIEETRGLTVIDVNSQGALRHSLPFARGAVREVLRQIRLRDLGGKIVVDLIGAPKDAKLLLQGIDTPSDLEIWGLSRMGLFEMIRRRKRLSLPQRLKLGLN
jgi:ribonuclease G